MRRQLAVVALFALAAGACAPAASPQVAEAHDSVCTQRCSSRQLSCVARCLTQGGADAEACISGCERAFDSCAGECKGGGGTPAAPESDRPPALAEPPSKPPSAPPTDSASDQFAGSFDIAEGRNPNGSQYRGTVEITKAGSAYGLQWSIPGSGYSGIGLVDSGVLGVGWGSGGSQGVIIYRREGKRLVGEWTASSAAGAVGTEVLEGPTGLPGRYKIVSASLPDGGASYSGSVEIRKAGDAFSVEWDTTAGKYVGVGIEKGGVFVVGWGNGVGVVAYELSGSRLDGTWAGSEGGDLGREVLEPR